MLKLSRTLGLAATLAGLSTAAQSAQIICHLTPGTYPTTIANKYGLTLADRSIVGEFYLMNPVGTTDIHVAETLMRTDPAVLWAEDDQSMSMPEGVGGGKGSTTSVVNDRARAYALNLHAFQQVGADQLFMAQTGRLVRIGVLDTGLSQNCGFLWSKVSSSYNVVDTGMPYDVGHGTDSNANGLRDEGVGHGTFVAGILDQMSPASKLIIVRVADSDGNTTAWRLVKGIAFAVATQAEVINISMGSIANIPAMTDILEWTNTKGVLVVAAAGNNGQKLLLNPAGITKAVAVTGVDGNDVKAPFSNYLGKIEACAPATGVLSYGVGGTLLPWSGTSFATPFVAGGVAECLRHLPVRVLPRTLQSAVQSTGANINAANPLYKNMLGRRLWMPGLWNALKGL